MLIKELITEISKKEGVYAGYNLAEESANLLVNWAISTDIKNIYAPDEMHVTVAYSKKYFSFTPKGKLKTPLKCSVIRPKWLGDEKDCLVLLLKCPELDKRFEETIKAGAHWDFPSYQPHVTISNDTPDIEIKELPPVNFDIFLDYEFANKLEDDWKDNVETINDD